MDLLLQGTRLYQSSNNDDFSASMSLWREALEINEEDKFVKYAVQFSANKNMGLVHLNHGPDFDSARSPLLAAINCLMALNDDLPDAFTDLLQERVIQHVVSVLLQSLNECRETSNPKFAFACNQLVCTKLDDFCRLIGSLRMESGILFCRDCLNLFRWHVFKNDVLQKNGLWYCHQCTEDFENRMAAQEAPSKLSDAQFDENSSETASECNSFLEQPVPKSSTRPSPVTGVGLGHNPKYHTPERIQARKSRSIDPDIIHKYSKRNRRKGKRQTDPNIFKSQRYKDALEWKLGNNAYEERPGLVVIGKPPQQSVPEAEPKSTERPEYSSDEELEQDLLQVGNDVNTAFGQGKIQEVRSDSVVVATTSWRLARNQSVILYLQKSCVDRVRRERKQKKRAPKDKLSKGVTAETDNCSFEVGDDVTTLFGEGKVLEVREQSLVVATTGWKLARNQSVLLYLQKSSVSCTKPGRNIKIPSNKVGDDVFTLFGEGKVVEIREHCLVVATTNWKLAQNQSVLLYLQEMSITPKRQVQTPVLPEAQNLVQLLEKNFTQEPDGKQEQTKQTAAMFEDHSLVQQLETSCSQEMPSNDSAATQESAIFTESPEKKIQDPIRATPEAQRLFEVGDQVSTLFGEGQVLEVRDGFLVIATTTWKLAGNQSVTLFLQESAAQRVQPHTSLSRTLMMTMKESGIQRPQLNTSSDSSLGKMVKKAKLLQQQALDELKMTKYDQAGMLYDDALDVLQYIKDSSSDLEEKADAMESLFPVYNNLALCLLKTSKFEDCVNVTGAALELADTLEQPSNCELLQYLLSKDKSEAKVLVYWKVRFLAANAKANLSLTRYEESIQSLEQGCCLAQKVAQEEKEMRKMLQGMQMLLSSALDSFQSSKAFQAEMRGRDLNSGKRN